MGQYLKIGEFSKYMKIPQQTLRYFEEIGIIKPVKIDENNGYRYYSWMNSYDIESYKFHKSLGMSVDHVKNFRAANSVEDSMAIVEASYEALLLDIRRKQLIANNYEVMMKRVKKKYAHYLKNPDAIWLETPESMMGVSSDKKQIRDWGKFHETLKSVRDKFPDYEYIGNSYGLSYTYDATILKGPESYPMDALFLAYYTDDEELMAGLEKYSFGESIVTYSDGNNIFCEATLGRINDFIKAKSLKLRGDIVVVDILNRFIHYDDKDYLVEIIIPLK